ncbi:MAG: molybdopterin converting factor [Bacteroidota bacterium]|nr:molybdopterin converting factor [Bacteroidota bacterium]
MTEMKFHFCHRLPAGKHSMMEEKKKKHNVLVEGRVTSTFIADAISKHSSKTEIGAHAIFLGQVRRDAQKDSFVKNIEYSAHPEMAEKAFEKIREKAFKKFDMICLHIHHSIGMVDAGEVSLFVFVSCKHRAQTFGALKWLVDEIKKTVPIWKKENYENGSYKWLDGDQPPM